MISTLSSDVLIFYYLQYKYVTGPEKTGLIYIKYTYVYYGVYLLLYKSYPDSVSFIEFLRIFCMYDEICVGILCNKNEL